MAGSVALAMVLNYAEACHLEENNITSAWGLGIGVTYAPASRKEYVRSLADQQVENARGEAERITLRPTARPRTQRRRRS